MVRHDIDDTMRGWPLGGDHLSAAMAQGMLDTLLPPYIGIDKDGVLLYTSPSAAELLVFPTGRGHLHLDAVLTPEVSETMRILRDQPIAVGERQVQWHRAPKGGMAVLRIGLEDQRELIVFQVQETSVQSPTGDAREDADLALLAEADRSRVLFVTSDLRLRRFTPWVRDVFRCRDIDIDRPLEELSATINVARLTELAQNVIESGVAQTADFATDPDGPIFAVHVYPHSDVRKADSGVVIALTDITQERNLAKEVERLSEQSRQRLSEIEQLYNVTPQAMGLIAPDMTYQRVNQRLAMINGTTVAAHMGQRVDDVVPFLTEQVTTAVRKVFETGERIESLRVTGRTAQRPSEDRVWETDWYPVRDAAQNICSVGVNVRDITDQVVMGEELRRVMQELQHRVQNMLSNVNALVSRMGRDAKVGREVFEELSSRIRALSQTHKLLTEAHWNAVPLINVLRPELSDVYGADRCVLKGPEFEVSARAAPPLCMAIHELATNAAKYGAFSVAEGHINLTWERRDDGVSDRYIFVWEEVGGPVPDKDHIDGFGAQLIASTLEDSLEGTVETEWRPEGLRFTFSVPTSILTERFDRTAFQVF